MCKYVRVFLVGVVCLLIGLLLAPHLPLGHAQGNKPKDPTWLYGLSLRSRKAAEKDFNDKTNKYGIEVFKDAENNNLIYISETGSIAVVPSK